MWKSSGGGGLGDGQTWQNVTDQRALGVTYTNSTGKPIMVSVVARTPQAGFSYGVVYAYVDNLHIATSTATAAGTVVRDSLIWIVPAGSTYRADGGVYERWVELR